MIISSRTPEGMPNHCVLCGRDLRVEPSIDSLDAPCPSCGHLLWFDPIVPSKKRRSKPKSYEGFLMGVGKERLGPFPIELQLQLFEFIGLLAKHKRLPSQ